VTSHYGSFLFRLVRRVATLVALASVGMASSSCDDASGCPSFEGHTAKMSVGQRQTVVANFTDGRWDGRLDAGGSFWITTEPIPPDAPREGKVTAEATLISNEVVMVDFPSGARVGFGPFSCE
jgi:hypothetical protein